MLSGMRPPPFTLQPICDTTQANHDPLEHRIVQERSLLTCTYDRSFLTRAYPTMKHHNPHTPIMIREALNIQPRVFARYEYGREKMADLQGKWHPYNLGQKMMGTGWVNSGMGVWQEG